MREYITKEQAMRRFKPFGREIPKEQVMAVLARIDEGIVRCKDCAYHAYEGDIPYCSKIDYGYGWKDNDFCSKGRSADA